MQNSPHYRDHHTTEAYTNVSYIRTYIIANWYHMITWINQSHASKSVVTLLTVANSRTIFNINLLKGSSYQYLSFNSSKNLPHFILVYKTKFIENAIYNPCASPLSLNENLNNLSAILNYKRMFCFKVLPQWSTILKTFFVWFKTTLIGINVKICPSFNFKTFCWKSRRLFNIIRLIVQLKIYIFV